MPRVSRHWPLAWIADRFQDRRLRMAPTVSASTAAAPLAAIKCERPRSVISVVCSSRANSGDSWWLQRKSFDTAGKEAKVGWSERASFTEERLKNERSQFSVLAFLALEFTS